jgi:hypothetical protein
MLISEKIRLLFSEEMLTRADQLYRESADGSFREKAVELIQPLLPLAPGMNGAAGFGRKRSRLSDRRVGICGRRP